FGKCFFRFVISEIISPDFRNHCNFFSRNGGLTDGSTGLLLRLIDGCGIQKSVSAFDRRKDYRNIIFGGFIGSVSDRRNGDSVIKLNSFHDDKLFDEMLKLRIYLE